MENIIIIAVVAIIIGLAGYYIHKEKKRGVRYIGCPSGCCCNGKCGNCSQSELSEESASINEKLLPLVFPNLGRQPFSITDRVGG